MKKFLKLKTMLLIISILIIIVGISNIFVAGMEKSIDYKAGTRIEIMIPKGYEKQDIISIAKESFGTDEILFIEVEKTNQVAGIKVLECSDEQFESYKQKISEKYEIEDKEIEYNKISVPETNIITIVKPYILPILFVTTLSLIYIIIKNFKSNNSVKISLRIIGILVITLALYFSIIGLFRLQFSIYTMPLALVIYNVTLILAINKKCE